MQGSAPPTFARLDTTRTLLDTVAERLNDMPWLEPPTDAR